MTQTRHTKSQTGHLPRKRFGQNFLQDDAIIDAIARSIAPRADEHIVEIGPGQGALTEALIGSGCQFDAIELDRDLTTLLLASFSVYPRFTLHSADALKFDFRSLPREQEKLRVVGNLPYNISTPLIFKLLADSNLFVDMHFMLQLEVVQRLAAQPGSKHWGRLGIMAQYRCTVNHLFDVPPTAFYPPPKVQSAIVRLTPKAPEDVPQCPREKLARVVQLAFAQRRKTLRNNFKGVFSDEALENLHIDPGVRAETLTLDTYVALANALTE